LEQGIPFLMDEWKYSVQGSDKYLTKIIQHNESAGIYVKDELVCGVTTHVNGLIGMLNTKETYRRKGYAQICMKTLIRNLAINLIHTAVSYLKGP
jgi:predicted GNAT family acetyltransferase